MKNVSWQEVKNYVAAGNLVNIEFAKDFTTIQLEIIYGDVKSKKEIEVIITCLNCSYQDFRRRNDHVSESGIILEAYIHKSSPLINALQTHQLEGKAGCLFLEDCTEEAQIFHLEVIGELSVNILCKDISFSIVGEHDKPGASDY